MQSPLAQMPPSSLTARGIAQAARCHTENLPHESAPAGDGYPTLLRRPVRAPREEPIGRAEELKGGLSPGCDSGQGDAMRMIAHPVLFLRAGRT